MSCYVGCIKDDVLIIAKCVNVVFIINVEGIGYKLSLCFYFRGTDV